jgi:hypothetical protein
MSENKSPAYYTPSQFSVRSDFVRDKANDINKQIFSLLEELKTLANVHSVPVECDVSVVSNTYIPGTFVSHIKELVDTKVDPAEIDKVLESAGCDERMSTDYKDQPTIYLYSGWTRSFC